MFKEHPWYGEEFGPVQYYWHLERSYCFNLLFELDNRPFIKFCKENKIKAHHLIMKLASRLSQKYLPQRVVSVNKKDYPARYPAGYVRKIAPDRDIIEFIAVREKENYFGERWVWRNLRPIEIYLMKNFPRLGIWLAKHFFGKREMRNWFALCVSRNPFVDTGFPVAFYGNNYWCFMLTIPYGDKVFSTLGGPHAFANVDYFSGFLKEFKGFYEHPETIPRELIEKPYRPVELGVSEQDD